MMLRKPAIWFFMNIAFWGILGVGLQKWMKHLAHRAAGTMPVSVRPLHVVTP